jgi:hypothetical protein
LKGIKAVENGLADWIETTTKNTPENTLPVVGNSFV